VAAAKARTRLTFQQYADTLYLPWAELKRRRSYKTIRTEVTWLVSVLGAQDLAALTQADLERVLDDLQRGHSPSGRPLSGAAVNRYRARLSGMFKRAMKRGLVERNPIAGTEKEAEPSGRIVYLPGETRIRPAIEEQAVREALTPALHPLFTVSVHTGLRWSEQRALQWRDVDLLAGFLTVRHSKNGRTRQVPMNSLVRSVLLDLATQRERPDDPKSPVFRCSYREPDKFFPAAVQRARRALEAIGKETGHLEGYTWHGNRHTFASRLVMAGVDLRTVQQLGGWQSLAMVQRYAHLAPDHLRAAVERLVQAPEGKALG
jgi:site-specific recombinase XerD